MYAVEGDFNERGCGPEPLAGNRDYAQFANSIGKDFEDFLYAPEQVENNQLELDVALWRYMTIRSGG